MASPSFVYLSVRAVEKIATSTRLRRPPWAWQISNSQEKSDEAT